MGELVALVLVCALATPPGECTKNTAQDVLRAPGGPTPISCLMAAQATAARTPEMLAGAYVLTACDRRKG